MSNRRKVKPGRSGGQGRKPTSPLLNRAETEQDRGIPAANRGPVQGPAKGIQRSRTEPGDQPLDLQAVLALQQTIGNRASSKLISSMKRAGDRPALPAAPDGATLQRQDDADYAFEEDTIYGDGGSGYGYGFGEGPLAAGDGSGYSGGGGSDYEEGSGEDAGGDGYGYGFGEGPLSGGGF